MDKERNGEEEQGKDGEAAKRKERKQRLDGDAPDPDGLEGHPAKINRFAPRLDQNRNIGVRAGRRSLPALAVDRVGFAAYFSPSNGHPTHSHPS
jgi:hypothetical protein